MQSFRGYQNRLMDLVRTGRNKSSDSMKFSFIAFLVLLLTSCNNFSDPSIEVLTEYNFGYSDASTNIAVGGEYLPDSLFVDVNNLISPLEVAGFNVEFEVLSGGGSIDNQKVLTRKDGKAATRWKLGTQSFSQTAAAKIYSPDGKFLSGI